MPKNRELSANVNNSSVQAPLFADETAIVLTKESNENQIKIYFQAILIAYKLEKQFPINLDEVWQLAYSDKGKAVRALKKTFIEGIDYEVFSKSAKNPSTAYSEPLAQNGKRENGGRFYGENKVTYMLSIPCLEYFIARKVRPVFEVYRKVFHKVVTGRKEVIYTEKEVKQQLLDAERQVREAVSTTNQLHARNAQLTAQVKTLVSLYEKEVMDKINILSFIEQRRLTEELKAYMG